MVSIEAAEMASEMNRYIAGFLLAVGLIVVVIILIIRGLTSSSSTPTSNAPADLSSYVGSSTSVQFTIDSPVTSADKHHDIIINVSNYQATVTVTKGYDSEVVSTRSYPMSSSSYAVFLKALQYNGFTQGNNDPSLKDERGHCALSDRFIYQVIDSTGNDIQRYWNSTCGTGSFNGLGGTIRQLFVKQIPDYGDITRGIQL